MTTIPEAADAGDQNTDSPAPGSTHEQVQAVKTILLGFSWSNYGLDLVEGTVSDPDCQDWANDLAVEVVAALA